MTDWVVGETRGTTQQRSSSSLFCRRPPCEQFWHGQGCPLFDVVHSASPLLTTPSPSLQGTLKDGLAEALFACNMPDICSSKTCYVRTYAHRKRAIPGQMLTSPLKYSYSVCWLWYAEVGVRFPIVLLLGLELGSFCPQTSYQNISSDLQSTNLSVIKGYK